MCSTGRLKQSDLPLAVPGRDDHVAAGRVADAHRLVKALELVAVELLDAGLVERGSDARVQLVG